MIVLTLAEIAAVVGGEVVGDATTRVHGPVVLDGREAGPGSLFVAFVGERTDGHEHTGQASEAGAVAVLGSRPTELPTVVVTDPRAALQRLASYVVTEVRRAGTLAVVGITGSQGKTSTKDLIGAILGQAGPTVVTRGSYNNELGMPLTALGVDRDTRFLVLELGARGIGHIAALTALVTPDVGVVLNVGQAHIGEFGSQDAIAIGKGELVECLPADGTAVLNADDPRVAAMRARTQARVSTFGAAGEVRVEGLRLDRLGRPSFELVAGDERVAVDLKLVGAHQAHNAAAAAAAVLALGLSLAQVGEALATVTSLSRWRMELHELPSGVTLLNDAYNANPDSTRAAIDALVAIGADDAVRRTVAVLGEMRELGDTATAEHTGIGAYAAEHDVDVVLVVGDPARPIADGAGERSVVVPDNDAALAWLRTHLAAGDAVLVKASNGARLYDVAAALQ